MYFPKHRPAIEVDEKGHTDRKECKDDEKKEKIQNELGCTFTRINPDTEDYDEYVEFSKIINYINE